MINESKNPTLIRGDLGIDDRGSVSFVNDFDFHDVKRFYVVENHRAHFIRAWHAHKNEGKYVFVAKGSAIVASTRIDNWIEPTKDTKIFRYVLSEGKPSILFIPPGFANGFMSLTQDLKIMFFSTSSLEESEHDDFRFDANYFGAHVWSVIER